MECSLKQEYQQTVTILLQYICIGNTIQTFEGNDIPGETSQAYEVIYF